MQASFIVINYNSWKDVLLQLEAIQHDPELKSGEAEWLVVDNHSPDEPPVQRPIIAGVRYVDLPTNGGFAAGVNAGAKESKGRWLILMNPDIEMKPGKMGELIHLTKKHQAQENTGVVGVRLLNADGSPQPSAGNFPTASGILKEIFIPAHKRRYSRVSASISTKVDWVTGACFLINKKAFEAVGGFDSDYFLYFEETDFCHRLNKIGWLCMFDPSVSIGHLNPLQNRTTSPVIRIYTRHGRLLFFRKTRPVWEFWVMCMLVCFESFVRQLLAKLKGKGSYAEAWAKIRIISMGFLLGSAPMGINLRRFANDEPS
jgi:GT2 family glycosyltransferase